jgi:HEPN domain-containing protein
MSDIYKEWMHSAMMDLRSIEKILDDPFLTPVACFHAQQCVEKAFKAILEKQGREVPKTHDIIRLFGLTEIICDLEIDIDLLQRVSELYIETRYPGNFGLLPDGKPSLDEAKSFFLFAQDVYEVVRSCLDR